MALFTLFWAIWILLNISNSVHPQEEEENTLVVGALLDDAGIDEAIFSSLVQKINAKFEGIGFSVSTRTIESGNSLQALLQTCSFLQEKAIALFGPKLEHNINAAQSVCDDKDIPHLVTNWLYRPLEYSTIINFHPHPHVLSLVFIDIITNWEWKSATILYDDNDSLLRVSEVIRIAKENALIMTVQQLDVDSLGVYRDTFKKILKSGERNLIIDCNSKILQEVLSQAQQIGLMTNEYSFLITNLDMQTVDMERFQYCGANITGIRILDPNNPEVLEMAAGLFPSEDDTESPDESPQQLTTEIALLIDSLYMFVNAIFELSTVYDFNAYEIDCNNTNSLSVGTTLINVLRTSEYKGLTGVIKFDNKGYRSQFDVDVIELSENGFVKIGSWNTSNGLQISGREMDGSHLQEDSLRNKTFIVITALTDPYGMLKETTVPLHGNDRFEGFGIDLIQELSLMEGFNYTFIIRHDKNNGKGLPNGSWSGMIGDVMEGRADFAIADLTITKERATAVDFTTAFMNLGISILAKKPTEAPPSFFSFADPFAVETWMMLALAYVVVSLTLFILGRLSPDEWTNPYPCIEEPEFLINQFTLQNSVWFVCGSLMQQGTEIAPISISTRMVAGMWWFFVLLMVSSYTANLAAFLTTEKPINLFTDVYSLVENKDKFNIKMGAKAGGATASFFAGKEEDVFKAIEQYFEEHPEDMVPENKDGVARAEAPNEAYAFFMESTSIEYEVQRHCNLMQYGKLLDDKGYGIAMKKDSPYRKRLSTAILKLHSSGQIEKLKRKWWEERRGGGQCVGGQDDQEATPLDLKNVEGVFVVTIAGTFISLLLVFVEMLVNSLRHSIQNKINLKEVLKEEFKSYFNFNSNVKPVVNAETKSNEGEESLKESPTTERNNINPLSYGFIPTVSRERLTPLSNN